MKEESIVEQGNGPFQENWVDRLSRFGALLGGWCLAIMAAMVSYEVVVRYFFNMPTIWSEELSIYCMLGSSFLGGAHLLKKDGHIRVDMLINSLPPRKAMALHLTTSLLGILLFGVAFGQGLRIVLQSFEQDFLSVPMRIPMFIPQMIIPLGALLFILQLIVMVNEDIKQLSGKTGGKKKVEGEN
jgi:TRAP-type C4-dicarboxylate transport system permease small subunit